MITFLVVIILLTSLTNSGECYYAHTHKVEIEAVAHPVAHGEGPYWDNKDQVLYYVDMFQPTILRWKFANRQLTTCKLDGTELSIVIPIKNTLNKFIVSIERSLQLLTWDGKNNNTGTLKYLTAVEANIPNNNFNDGKVDINGNLWIGTFGLESLSPVKVVDNGGSLYRIQGNNIKSPTKMVSSVSLSNGMAWNKDNTRFFYTDSERRIITAFDFNRKTDNIDSPVILFNVTTHPTLQGIPDGMTIDRDDNIWTALYGGKAVIQFDSVTGELLRAIEMPTTYVTSVTFGGPDLDILYVTSSKQALTSRQMAEEPLAGSLFALYNLGARGWPANEFQL